MLVTRVITAAILAPLLILLLLYGNKIVFAGLLFLSMQVTIWELCSMLFVSIGVRGEYSEMYYFKNSVLPQKKGKIFLTVICLVVANFMYLAQLFADKDNILALFNLLFFLAAVVFVFFSPDIRTGIRRLMVGSFIILYGMLPWASLWSIFQLEFGRQYILLVLVVVFFGDTGGYFFGRYLGHKIFKRKLAPVMSPNKTIEGALGGVLLSMLGGLMIKGIFPEISLNHVSIVVISCFCGFLAQFGDLIESSIKRYSKVKDSGKILPGHGGLLDRLDGVIFAAPFFWLLIKLFS